MKLSGILVRKPQTFPGPVKFESCLSEGQAGFQGYLFLVWLMHISKADLFTCITLLNKYTRYGNYNNFICVVDFQTLDYIIEWLGARWS